MKLFSKTNNKEIEEIIANSNETDRAKYKAKILYDFPWSITRVTTILFGIPIFIDIVFSMSIWFINSSNYETVWRIAMIGELVISATSIPYLFIIIFGFLLMMPELYIIDNSDSVPGASYEKTDVQIGNKGFEIVHYPDGDIQIYKRGAVGAANRIIYGFKAVGYQFRVYGKYKRELKLIEKKDASLLEYYDKRSVSGILEAKRTSRYVSFLKMNFILSIVNIIISLTTIVVSCILLFVL